MNKFFARINNFLNIPSCVETCDKNHHEESEPFSFSQNDASDVIKEGWVKAPQRFVIKTWRSRYFVLKSNGIVQVFIRKGDKQSNNNFCIVNCKKITSYDRPKPFSLTIELSDGSIRTFCLKNQEELNSWAASLKTALDNLPQTLPVATIQNLEFLHILGIGSFGKVYLTKDSLTSKYYATKKMNKERLLSSGLAATAKMENKILTQTSHPFLIKMKRSFQTAENLFCVLEFANGGELFQHMKKSSPFSEDKTRFYTAEIVSAIVYLHASGIIYRDLKPENVLLDRWGHVKIADFGLCQVDVDHTTTLTSYCGTIEYMAPEIIRGLGYSFSVDWWSLGVLIFEMTHGNLPFHSKERQALCKEICDSEVRYSGKIGPEAEDLVKKLLTKEPQVRLGAGQHGGKEIMDHRWFTSIDWDKLYYREVEPPFVPQLKSESDLEYFDKTFTRRPIDISSFDNDCTDEFLFCIADINDDFANFELVNDCLKIDLKL